jgi:hypothetical protein
MSTGRRSNAKFFALDDRCIGGTHMIQQQFKDMHRKIDHARKHVDNEPPMASMFKRPHFGGFGVDYRERVRERTMPHVRPRVDCKEPDSYYLIANLYINRKERSQYASPVHKERPTPGEAEPHGRVTYATRPRPLSARVATVSAAAPGLSTMSVLNAAAADQSIEGYATSIADRLDEIAAHREALRRRRILRRTSLTATTGHGTPTTTPRGVPDTLLREAANAALDSGRASSYHQHLHEHHQQYQHGGAFSASAPIPGLDNSLHLRDSIPSMRSFTESGIEGQLRPGREHFSPLQAPESPGIPAQEPHTASNNRSAVEGVLRGPTVPVGDVLVPRPPTSGFPVPTPPARTTRALPSPPNLRRTPPTSPPPLAGETMSALAAVAAPLRGPPGLSLRRASEGTEDEESAPPASSVYGVLRFPSTVDSPDKAARVGARAVAGGQVVTANDFVEPYDDSDDDVM